MDHLIMREISLGGYCLGFTPFHRFDDGASSSSTSSSLSSSPSSSFPSSPSSSSLSSMSSMDEDDVSASFSSSSSSSSSSFTTVPALVFSATTENEFYLGPEKMTSMAKTIAHAEGPSGHNVEYLVKICDFMREELPPDIGDNHLYQLERLTLECLARRGVNFQPLAYPELFECQDKNCSSLLHERISQLRPLPSQQRTKHRNARSGKLTDSRLNQAKSVRILRESDGIDSEESDSSSSDPITNRTHENRSDANRSNAIGIIGVTTRTVSNDRRRWQRRLDLNLTFYSP